MPKATLISPQPKQDRAVKTRQEVLLAAARVFDQVGYPAARLEEICREADVTKGALYFHFRSKAELARAVVTAHFAKWRQLRADVEQFQLDPLTHVVALSFAVAGSYRDDVIHRSGVRLVKEYRLIEIEVPKPFVGWIGELTVALTKAQEVGVARPTIDCAAAAHSIVASYFGMQEMSDRVPGEDLVARLRQWWTLVLPTLSADPERTPTILARFDCRGQLVT